jgi:ATP-dependent DNA helicase RecG
VSDSSTLHSRWLLLLKIEEWNDIKFLNKAKITSQGKITNTTILLLGKPESEHFIKPAVAKITRKQGAFG